MNANTTMGEEKVEESPPPEESATGLRLAIEVISGLISISHSIKVFSGKWQLIRNKLDELLSSLTAFENCDSGDDDKNPFLSGAVQEIIATVNDSNELAKRCLEFSYSGKLLMQSDLDMLAARFDTHVKSLSDIYTNGFLTSNYAIVVSRPGPTASRDDMKFYVQDLLSRFRIGGMDMKKQALVAFNEMLDEDERYVKVCMEVDGIVSVFLNFLDSQEIEIQEAAAKALSVISGSESSRLVLVTAGVIAPLVRVLEGGSELGKEYATRCLQKVTENSNNAWSISAHGGVTALLKICTSMCDCGGELVGLSCGVLKNLVGVEEIKRFMVEEDAIPLFIKLARSKDDASQINAIELLQTMASGDETLRSLIVNEGGIRVLARVWDPKLTSSSTKAKETALRAVVKFCSNSMGNFNCLMGYGFMDHILYFLRNGEVPVQEVSLKAAFWLCGMSEEVKKAMGDAGFMPELVKSLDAKSFEVREMAAETLSSLVVVPRNRRRLVQSDQSVSLLLQLVDPEEGNSGNSKLLLTILMSLTSCNSGRKKIVSSGYLKNIEKLADAQVSDAKKIVKNLSTNRFKSILRGMWHS